MGTCAVDGCEKKRRTASAEHCEMHYYRLRRRGSLEARTWHRRGACSVGGCAEPERYQGRCAAHYYRWLRNGRTEAIPHCERAMPTGRSNPKWTGDDATYAGVHQRIRKNNGPASRHNCIDCGTQAAQWSYTHAAQHLDARSSSHGAYSVNPDDYVPRCVRCHKRFDLDVIAKRRTLTT